MADVVNVEHLSVVFPSEAGSVPAVTDVSFRVQAGESLGIVGESGSGKSTIAFALFNSVPPPGEITGGAVRYFGQDNLYDMSYDQQRRLFWEKVAMVFQAAQNTLNPLLRIRQQILDIAQDHDIDFQQAMNSAKQLCEIMYLDSERVLNAYPHELSGGMKQRVSIALALLLNPSLVVLDEPTTALDVISQASVLRILNDVRKSHNLSLIFITHDISVISEIVDRIIVMYAGRIVETGPVRDVILHPRHPYTQGLLASIPPLRGNLSRTRALRGQPADLLHLPHGCAFHERCPRAFSRCRQEAPRLLTDDHGQTGVACHLYASDSGENVL
ncbi:MAG: ABC transporter ATP-binding protein [Firmicutes bacterium]|nr:ABC transporter ATP-binding protein [Bacillota bacterium]